MSDRQYSVAIVIGVRIYRMQEGTWVGLVAGIIIGTIITWWVYNRQKKTSDIQDKLLKQVVALENKILSLEEKIESILEKRK